MSEDLAFAQAARALVAREGLQRFSLRRLAQASGWTLGTISYRLGSRQQILLKLIAESTAAQLADDAAWLERLRHLPPGSPLSATLGAWLDDQACRRPDTLLFWGEMLQAALHDKALATALRPYIASRLPFWEKMLARHPAPHAVPGTPPPPGQARLLAFFLLEEPLYTLALGAFPAYRLLRGLALAHLCQSLAPVAADAPHFEQLTSELAASSRAVPPLGARAERVATLAGALLASAGPGAITHRAVAAQAGLSVSAITHHFPTHSALLRHAYTALHQQLPAIDRAAPAGSSRTYPGLHLVHANLLLLLVAARAARQQSGPSPDMPPEVQRLAQLRARRGGYSGNWTASFFPQSLDRLATQIVSLVIEGELMTTLAAGQPFAGRHSLKAIADLVAHAARPQATGRH